MSTPTVSSVLSLRAALAQVQQERRNNAVLRRQLTDLRRLTTALVDAIDHGAELRLRRNWYREGWRAAELAHADDYERGYHDGVLARKHAGIQLYEGLQLERRRWELRGEKRTRATFGRPHPDDQPPVAIADRRGR